MGFLSRSWQAHGISKQAMKLLDLEAMLVRHAHEEALKKTSLLKLGTYRHLWASKFIVVLHYNWQPIMAASLTKAVKVICHYDQLWLTIIKYHRLWSTTINCHQQTSETSDLNLASHVLLRRHRFDFPPPTLAYPGRLLASLRNHTETLHPKNQPLFQFPFYSTSCWIRGRIGGSLGKSVGEKASLGYMWLGDQDPLDTGF